MAEGGNALMLDTPPAAAYRRARTVIRGTIMSITASSVLDRVLVLEMVRVTEAAAIAASKLVGRGDEKAADAAAVEAMRAALNGLDMDGTVVIGEGERDEAPMLYIGEKVGTGKGPSIDIALDPLEGTTICAKAGPNSLAVLAIAEHGGLLNAPDVYMDKIAVGPGLPEGVIDLDKSPTENVRAIAAAKGVAPDEIIACVLDRPRHEKLIAELRGLGCGVMLIGDGDVAGVIATTNPETTIDVYMGSGGAPEGVLACAALRCVGGQFKGRLLFRNDDERARAHKWGVTDLDKQYDLSELASGDCIFAATGVTDGSLLAGVKRRATMMTTESVVMRASSGTVRWVKGEHRLGASANPAVSG
jgi:fructose-1,6-bisphosphatase II / sedoheptulose-1,7-bisphosphatase